jgi:hypothetical protein
MPTLAEARRAIDVLEARGDMAGAAAIRRDIERAGLSSIFEPNYAAQIEERERQRRERLEELRERERDLALQYREAQRGSLARGLDIGTDIVGQATGSTLEGLGRILGLEGLEQYGAEVALENEADAQRKARFQTRFDDIEGVGDFFSYLGGIAAESAPAMAAGIAGGIGAAAAAPLLGLGALGTGIAGVAGASAAGLPFFYGMNRERQKEAIEAGLRTEIDEGAAALTAIPQAILDGIVDRLLVGGLGLTNRTIGGGGIFTRGTKGTVAGAVVEAPTEIGQQVLERAQAGLPIDDEEALAEYREAGIAGGLLGGSIRGTTTVLGGDVAAREDAEARLQTEKTEEAIRQKAEEVVSGEVPAGDDIAAVTVIEREGEEPEIVVETEEERKKKVDEAVEELQKKREETGKEVTDAPPVVDETVEEAVEEVTEEVTDAPPVVDETVEEVTDAPPVVDETVEEVTEEAVEEVTEEAVEEVTEEAVEEVTDAPPVVDETVEEVTEEVTDAPPAVDETVEDRRLVLAQDLINIQREISALEEGSAERAVAELRRIELIEEIQTELTNEPGTEPDIDGVVTRLEDFVTDFREVGDVEQQVEPQTGVQKRRRTAEEIKDEPDSTPVEFEEAQDTLDEQLVDTDADEALLTEQAEELAEAVENVRQRKEEIEGQKTPRAKKTPRLPQNERLKLMQEFHKERVEEAKEYGDKPPTRKESYDEYARLENANPNLRRIEGTQYSVGDKAGLQRFPESEEIAQGRTPEELTAERDRLLKETVGGTLVDAVKNVQRNANNPFELLLAKNLVKLIQRMENIGYDFKYRVNKVGGNVVKTGVRGQAVYDYKKQRIIVRLKATDSARSAHNGLTHKTLLHEAIHAVTMATNAAFERELIPTTNKLQRDAADLSNLYSEIMRYIEKQINDYIEDPTKTDDDYDDLHPVIKSLAGEGTGTNYLTDPNELLAWGLTDSEMQDFLDSVPYNPRTGEVGKGTSTLWKALVDALRKLLSLPPKDNTALNELLRVQTSLLNPRESDLKGVKEGFDNQTKQLAEAEEDSSVVQARTPNFALVSRPEEYASKTLSSAYKNIPILNSKGVQRIQDVVADSSIPERGRSAILGFLSLNGLDMLARKYIPKIGKVRELVLKEGGRLQELKRPVDATINKISNFAKNNKKKVDILNRLMPYSSLIGVDPSKDRKTYEEDADKLAEYDAMHASDGDWTSLGEDGQKIYRTIRNTYEALYKQVGEVLKVRLEATNLDPEKRKNVYDELINKLYKNATIDPYFPLIREGEYRLEYTATDPNTGQSEYFTESFESKSQRRKAMEELNAIADEINLTDMRAFRGNEKPRYNNAPAGSFVNNVLNVLSANDVEEGVRDEVIKLFLDTLPERSFAQSFRSREGYRGFIGDPAILRDAKYPQHDMVRALRIRTASVARQIVRMEFASEFQKLEAELDEDFKKYDKSNASQKDKDAARQYLAEVKKRIDFAKNPDVENWAKNLTTFGFATTLGLNLSSVLVNFSQIPMVIAPHLAGTRGDDGEYFGYSDTTKAIGEAVRLFKNAGKTDENYKYLPFIKKREAPAEAMGPDGTEQVMVPAAPSIDNYDYGAEGIPPEIKEFEMLAKVAEEQGQLNKSIVYDTLDMEEIDSVRGKIGAVSGFLFHHGERMTRQVGLAAAYRLKVDSMKRAKNNLSKADFNALSPKEKANIKLSEAEYREAAEFAVYEVELTNGGTAAASAPRYAQRNIGKVAFLYKRYGIQMVELIAKLANESIRGTPAEKAQARRQLFGVMGGSALMAGAQGLPLYGVVATVYDLFKGDDDEDFDTVVRKTIGEELYSGPVNAVLGVDVASRMGLSDLIFRDRLIEKQQPFLYDLIEVLGGPVVGQTLQIDRGIDKMLDGEIYRGAESMAPAFLRNPLKAYRFYEDGAKTQRGDVIVEDISAPLLVAQFFGFAPASYTRQLAENAQLKKISSKAAKQRTGLLRKYYSAVRAGDYSRAMRLRQEMLEFNSTYPSFAITPDTIKRSMAQHMRTSKKMHYGVTINPRMFNDMKQSAAEYDDTLTIWDNLGL